MKTNILKKSFAGAILTFLLFFAGISGLRAQSAGYRTGIGLRFGSDFGITARTTVGSGYIEGIVGSGYRAFMVTGLYERFLPAFHREDFHWYFGAGAHIGFWDRWYRRYGYYDRWGYYRYDYVYGYSDPTFGIDGIFGLEYKFSGIPFAASIDVKPFIDIYRYGYGFIEGAFSFRYTIGG